MLGTYRVVFALPVVLVLVNVLAVTAVTTPAPETVTATAVTPSYNFSLMARVVPVAPALGQADDAPGVSVPTEIARVAAVERVEPPPPPPPVLAAEETVKTVPYEVWAVLQQVFGDRYRVFARIAYCESRFVATAVGEGKYRGWFQIDPGHLIEPDVLAALGWSAPPSADVLFDPLTNARVALVLAERRPSLGDWPGTRNGCADWNSG